MNTKTLAAYFGILAIGVAAFIFLLANHKDYGSDGMAIASQEDTSDASSTDATDTPNAQTEKLSLSSDQAASSSASASASSKILDVPYVSEAPNNNWTGPWKNACEEASAAMVEGFYKGQTTISLDDAKIFMERLFNVEDEKYGSNANSDAERTNYLVNNYSDYTGTIVENPSIDDIKKQIDSGHPVIAFHDGFDLHNADIPFLPTGSAYHSTVVIGYDDASQEFIVNDPGDEQNGVSHRYSYTTYMNSLHDYDYNNKLADGPARVIFTSND